MNPKICEGNLWIQDIHVEAIAQLLLGSGMVCLGMGDTFYLGPHHTFKGLACEKSSLLLVSAGTFPIDRWKDREARNDFIDLGGCNGHLYYFVKSNHPLVELNPHVKEFFEEVMGTKKEEHTTEFEF